MNKHVIFTNKDKMSNFWLIL